MTPPLTQAQAVGGATSSGILQRAGNARGQWLLPLLSLVFLLSLSVQDLQPTTAAFGRAGGILTYFVTPLMFAVTLLKSRRTNPGRLPWLIRVWMAWFAVTLVLSLLAIPLFPDTRGTAPASKVLKYGLVFALFILTMVTAKSVRELVGDTILRRIVAACLLINLALLVAYAIGVRSGPLSIDASFWHVSVSLSAGRPRLLTPEASTAGALIIGLVALMILLSERAVQWLPWAVVSTVLLVLVASRGSLYSVLLAVILTGASYPLIHRQSVVALSFAGGFVALLFTLFASTVLLQASATIPSEAQSNATRAAYADAAIIVLRTSPVGGTFAGSLYLSNDWVTEAAAGLYARTSADSLAEIVGVLTSGTADNFSPKTFPAYVIFQSGWLGLGLVVGTAVLLLQAAARARRGSVLLVVWLVLISCFTYVDAVTAPQIAVVVGMVVASATRVRPLEASVRARTASRLGN